MDKEELEQVLMNKDMLDYFEKLIETVQAESKDIKSALHGNDEIIVETNSILTGPKMSGLLNKGDTLAQESSLSELKDKVDSLSKEMDELKANQEKILEALAALQPKPKKTSEKKETEKKETAKKGSSSAKKKPIPKKEKPAGLGPKKKRGAQ